MGVEPGPLVRVVSVLHPLHHRDLKYKYLVRFNDVLFNAAQFVGRVTVTCPTLSEKFLKYDWYQKRFGTEIFPTMFHLRPEHD